MVNFSFAVDFNPTKINGQDYCAIKVKIKGNKLKHKIVLTYLRNFFEYPANVVTRETLDHYHEIVKPLKVGNSISWFNVYLAIESCYPIAGGHSFQSPYRDSCELFTKKEWIHKFKRAATSQLNTVFSGIREPFMAYRDMPRPENFDQLQDPQHIQRRVNYYTKILATKLEWLRQ